MGHPICDVYGHRWDKWYPYNRTEHHRVCKMCNKAEIKKLEA